MIVKEHYSKTSKMKTLVLGGNGFIGSHLVDKLLSEGHDVSVFDKYKEYFREPLKNVNYFYGDFGNRGEIGKALKGIDTVFHLIIVLHILKFQMMTLKLARWF